jgi:hypothetical protein
VSAKVRTRTSDQQTGDTQTINDFLENPWEGFATKTLYGFPETLYGFFTLCEKNILGFLENLQEFYTCW